MLLQHPLLVRIRSCAKRLPTPKYRAIFNPNVSDKAKVIAEKPLEELEMQEENVAGHTAVVLKAKVTFSLNHS